MNEAEALGIDFILGALRHFAKGTGTWKLLEMGYNAGLCKLDENMYIRHKIFHEV